MAKALMLIRELEFYDRSMLHKEQPMQLKVCLLHIVAQTSANPDRPISLRISILCSALLYLLKTNRHCVSQLAMRFLLVSRLRLSYGTFTDMRQASRGLKIPSCKLTCLICFVAQNGKTAGRGVMCNSKSFRLGERFSIYPYRLKHIMI